MNPFNRSASIQPYRLACLLLVLLAGMAVVAQSQTGSEISGTVFDPSGEALAEAKIILRQSANSTEQTKNTDPKGQFRFTRLAGGEYEIEVQKTGSKQPSPKSESAQRHLRQSELFCRLPKCARKWPSPRSRIRSALIPTKT